MEEHVLQRPDQQTFGKKLVRNVLLPVARTLSKETSPTKELGKFLSNLASGDGKPLSGEGVSGDGWIVSNAAFRRMSGI